MDGFTGSTPVPGYIITFRNAEIKMVTAAITTKIQNILLFTLLL
jgi:hypothetical protein